MTDEIQVETEAQSVERVEPLQSKEFAEPDSLVTAEEVGDNPADDQRLTTSILILGGLAMVFLGQATAAVAAMDSERLWVYLITGLGVAAFLLGGSMVTGRAAAPRLLKPFSWLARRLDIAVGQAVLLLMALLFALLASYAAGEVLAARGPIVSVAVWLCALFCAVAATIRSRRDIPARIERSEIIFTAVVFGLALLLRGLATELIPTTFSGDEGAAGLSSVQFANGPANNIFTVGWFDFPSLYFALQSLGIHLLGQTIPALRVMSALGGALTIVAVYWLARSMFNTFIARLSAIILMASHYHIHLSRIALNNVWDGLFAAAAVFGLWYGWKSDRRIGFVICGLALGLGQYFYVTIRIVPLIFLVWAAAAWFTKRRQFRHRLPGFLLPVYIPFITFLPMGLYYANHLDQFMARIMPVSVANGWLAVEAGNHNARLVQVFVQQLTKAVGGFIYEPLRLLYDPGVPLLLVTAAALFLIGILWSFFNPDLRYLLLLLPILATIFIVAVSKDPPSSQRYIMAIPFVVIFVALPLGLMRDWLRELWPDYGRLAALPAILMVTYLAFADVRYYFTQAYADGYILGGENTLVATEVAYYLDEQEGAQDVYFYGFPRMGYRSHATIPYLVPRMIGHDIEPEGGVPTPALLNGTTQFVFLPERLQELQYVLSLYPHGQYREFFKEDNELLFAVYEVNNPE